MIQRGMSADSATTVKYIVLSLSDLKTSIDKYTADY